MKKVLVFVLVVICCSFVSSALAQTVTDEAEIIRSALQTEKKAVVAANMDLTDAESQVFWPVYDEYQMGLRQINEKMAAVIVEYAKNYSALTDDEADELLKGYLVAEKERLALKNKFVKKFKRVLPAIKVVRYYQVEHTIETIVRYQLVQQIHLAK